MMKCTCRVYPKYSQPWSWSNIVNPHQTTSSVAVWSGLTLLLIQGYILHTLPANHLDLIRLYDDSDKIWFVKLLWAFTVYM